MCVRQLRKRLQHYNYLKLTDNLLIIIIHISKASLFKERLCCLNMSRQNFKGQFNINLINFYNAYYCV